MKTNLFLWWKMDSGGKRNLAFEGKWNRPFKVHNYFKLDGLRRKASQSFIKQFGRIII